MKDAEIFKILTPLHFTPSLVDDGYSLIMSGVSVVHESELEGKTRVEILNLARDKILDLAKDYDDKIQAMLERIQMALDDSLT